MEADTEIEYSGIQMTLTEVESKVLLNYSHQF